MPEIPAGMVDERTGQFRGVAAQEMREETGLVIKQKDLVDLTELAYGNRFRGMIPSAGGCDETLRLFLYRKQVTQDFLNQLDGRMTGNEEEGERIVLKLMELDKAWTVSPDAKLLGALCLYDRLKGQGRLPALAAAAAADSVVHGSGTGTGAARRRKRTKQLVSSEAQSDMYEMAKRWCVTRTGSKLSIPTNATPRSGCPVFVPGGLQGRENADEPRGADATARRWGRRRSATHRSTTLRPGICIHRHPGIDGDDGGACDTHQ